MNTLIYKIMAPNNKLYIGQVNEKKGINERWKQHIRSASSNPEKGCRFLNRAILKYGENNFHIEKICKVNSKVKDITEQFCISFYKTLAPNGYNLQKGGTFTQHSDETKRKRSESLRNLLKSNDKRKVWSDAKKNIPQDNKQNRKFSEDYLLPKYLRCLRGKSEGYSIDSHPLCKCKKFTSKKLSKEEKYNLAVFYLNELNNKTTVQRLNGSG